MMVILIVFVLVSIALVIVLANIYAGVEIVDIDVSGFSEIRMIDLAENFFARDDVQSVVVAKRGAGVIVEVSFKEENPRRFFVFEERIAQHIERGE